MIHQPTTMKTKLLLSLAVLTALLTPALHADDPVVSNVFAEQRPGTKLVDITFQVSDADLDLVNLSVNVSDDAGLTFNVPSSALTGDTSIAATATPTPHALVWDAGMDFNQQFSTEMVVRVIADDGSALGPAPPGMALIPAGKFKMGDQQVPTVGDSDALPVHEVYVSAFYMDKYEVTLKLWNKVKAWAEANGYEFSNVGFGQGAQHPVHTINWYDAIKWCNARSEMEGLTPVYSQLSQSDVYRASEVAILQSFVRWSANGYRLPTEAEWEKAARGGLTSNRYPWGQGITGADANYESSGDPFDGLGFKETTPVDFYDGKQWSTYGEDRANGYGLYDMAGNVWEWCWDIHNSGWYGAASAMGADTNGPNTIQGTRVLRGGSWLNDANDIGCAVRGKNVPGSGSGFLGFRSARGL